MEADKRFAVGDDNAVVAKEPGVVHVRSVQRRRRRRRARRTIRNWQPSFNATRSRWSGVT
jgi:hypothetical protein